MFFYIFIMEQFFNPEIFDITEKSEYIIYNINKRWETVFRVFY